MASATGPTSASDGVRTPPVRMTSTPAAPCRASAMRRPLVTTVRSVMPAPASSSASRYVVVPADSATACPGSIVASAARAIAAFSGPGPGALRVEAGLVGGSPEGVRSDRAAVHATDQPGAGELGDVPPDGHVRDVEALHQVGDAGGPVGAHGSQDPLLTLRGEHPNTLARNQTNFNTPERHVARSARDARTSADSVAGTLDRADVVEGDGCVRGFGCSGRSIVRTLRGAALRQRPAGVRPRERPARPRRRAASERATPAEPGRRGSPGR